MNQQKVGREVWFRRIQFGVTKIWILFNVMHLKENTVSIGENQELNCGALQLLLLGWKEQKRLKREVEKE